MKAITTLPAPATAFQPKVKKVLIMGIIYLTSEKFSIFVSVTAALMAYIGVLLDDIHTVGLGGIIFLVGFTPWALRETARGIRQDRLSLKDR